MRLSLRFVVPLFLALGIFAYAAVPLVDKLTLRWFSRDLDMRANLIANTVEEPLQDLIKAGNRRRMLQFFTRITQDERLLALGFCPADGGEPVASPTLPKEVDCAELDRFDEPKGNLLQTAKGPVLVSVRPLATAAPDSSRVGIPMGSSPSISIRGRENSGGTWCKLTVWSVLSAQPSDCR